MSQARDPKDARARLGCLWTINSTAFPTPLSSKATSCLEPNYNLHFILHIDRRHSLVFVSVLSQTVYHLVRALELP
jgi:hypothetical protein